jgi:hypothetical protein
LANLEKGLRVIDISTPSNPREVGFFQTRGWARDVAVSDQYIYLVAWNGDLHILRNYLATMVRSNYGKENLSLFALFQNFPNPFNPTTTIEYDIPKNVYVELTIIDLLGRHVRTLVAEEKPAGHHQVTWNGLDDAGDRVASGVYLYRLTAEGYSETRKLLLIR